MIKFLFGELFLNKGAEGDKGSEKDWLLVRIYCSITNASSSNFP